MTRSSAYRGFHRPLVGRVFRLGTVYYLVGRDQPDPNCVRCYRTDTNVITISNLPLVFVLEQLADEVHLEEMA